MLNRAVPLALKEGKGERLNLMAREKTFCRECSLVQPCSLLPICCHQPKLLLGDVKRTWVSEEREDESMEARASRRERLKVRHHFTAAIDIQWRQLDIGSGERGKRCKSLYDCTYWLSNIIIVDCTCIKCSCKAWVEVHRKTGPIKTKVKEAMGSKKKVVQEKKPWRYVQNQVTLGMHGEHLHHMQMQL